MAKTESKQETNMAPVKTSAPKKTAAASTPKPSAQPAVVEVVKVVEPQETLSSEARLLALQETLKTLKADLASRLTAVSHELLEVSKSVKREQRDSRKRRKVDPATLNAEELAAWELRRSKNAFLKMRPLSDELCTFMGLPSKSQKSQTDVTKFVSQYVKAHQCFDPSFKRRILPDTKLAKLLRVKDKDEVTYLNLQRYLKVHFLKV
jgi:chromatin remodeling complex protein RSC6